MILEENTHALFVPFALKHRGNEAKLIIGDKVEELILVDVVLIKIISNAHRWMQQLQSGAAATIVEFAKSEGLDNGEVSRFFARRLSCPLILLKQSCEAANETSKKGR
jgi:hypothetical protein